MNTDKCTYRYIKHLNLHEAEKEDKHTFSFNVLSFFLHGYRPISSCEPSYCFSYDVIFTANAETILKKFLKFDANLVFSAEDFCWPDKSLAVSGLV